LRRLSFLVATAVLIVSPVVAEDVPTDDDKYRVSRLQGTVQLDRRNPVTGATVRVMDPATDHRLYLTSTDQSGKFRVGGLPNGDYVMTLRRQGLETVIKNDIQIKYPFRAVVEITMKPGATSDTAQSATNASTENGPATLDATVADTDGKPLSEVYVRVVRPDGSYGPRTVRTDEAGQFRMEELAPGPWRLNVRGAGFLWLSTMLEVEGTTELQIGLVSQPPGYVPTPNELMPPERPIPPTDLLR